MDERRLDGNAAAGVLAEIFTFEITTARAACTHCGATGEVGAQMAYVTEIGTVVRCAACDNPLIRVVRQDDGPERYWLDLKGIEYLQLRERL
jgi:NAD-dependent SIR2 family protein deacetylase